MERSLKIVDVEAFKKEVGLEGEPLAELYGGFLEELAQEGEKLRVLFAAGEYVKLGKTVHNIKGISGSYRAERLFETAKELDARIKVNQTGEISPVLEKLITGISEVDHEIRRCFRL